MARKIVPTEEMKQLAAEIATSLFTDGMDRKVDRLVMEYGPSCGGFGLCEVAVRNRIAGYLAGIQTCPTSTPSQNTKTTKADGSSSSRPRTRDTEASAPQARIIKTS